MGHDGQDASSASWIALAIEAITRWACRWPKATLWLVTASTVACSLYAWQSLTIKTDRSDLINPNAPYQKRWRAYSEAFNDVTEDLVVVVEGDSRETVIKAVNELGIRVQRETKFFRNVLFRIDLRKLAAKGLQYLPTEELEKTALKMRKLRMLSAVAPGAAVEQRIDAEERKQQAQAADVAAQIDQLVMAWQNYAHLPPEQKTGIQAQTSELIDHFLENGVAGATEGASAAQANSQSAGRVRYLINSSGTMAFVQAQPVVNPGDLNGATESVRRIRQIIAAVQKRHPDTRIGVTGVPVLEHDEMRQSQSEMSEASILSFVGVALVLFAGFKRLRHPVLGMLMLLVGTAWSFAAAGLAVGHLNILSIAFAAMLFGLGNDFAIVYMSHYSDLRERGMPLFDALLDTSRSVGPGITTAAFTAAAAFFAAVLTDFTGIAELGLIAGWGILLCNLLTFIFIPPALLIWDRHWNPEPPEIVAAPARSWRWLCIPTLAVFFATLGYFGQYAPKVRYDMNLLNMQMAGTEATQLQQRIDEKSDDSILYAVSLAKSRGEALDLKRKYEALPTVGHVAEIASMFPPKMTPRRQELITTISHAAAALADFKPATPNPSRIGQSLDALHTAMINTKDPAVADDTDKLDAFLDQLTSLPLDQQIQTLTPGGGQLAQLGTIATGASLEPVTLKDLPVSFTSRFVGKHDLWLLKVFPKEPVWDNAPLKKFVHDVRTVDPNVTGTPLQNYEASQAIWDSYLEAGAYALVAVLVLLWWDFRTIHETLLAISPAACGLLTTLGVLGRFNMPLNQANMIMLPLLMGLGVDGGVHVLHDYRSQRNGYRITGSTVRSILLTAATSIVGFGSLMVASHRGLFSLGFVLTVGVTAALVTAIVALPCLLSVITPPPSAAISAEMLSADADEANAKGNDRSAA
jgi:hopanoid biosynthesis associated RND transporter like protein HpnN